MDLKNLLKACVQRMATLEAESKDSKTSTERLAEINIEMEKEIEERNSLQAKIEQENKDVFERARKPVKQPSTLSGELFNEEEARTKIDSLKQQRSISLETIDVLSIAHQNLELKQTFNPVSNLVDLVSRKAFSGGETYDQGFVKSYGEAGYTAEGVAAASSDPVFGKAQIAKTKITAYTEVSEEFEKLKPQAYMGEIVKNLSISLRKKLAKEIVIGDGATGHLVGLAATLDKLTALDAGSALSLGAIDENTLNNIILHHGGSEDIYQGVIILNKTCLKSFMSVRGADKKPVYIVDLKNRTINGVSYVINSNIADHDTALAGTITMLYGTLGDYDLVQFSPVDVSKSTDFKFSTGQIAYKAVGFFGGNVVAYNAFTRVTKSA